MRAAEPLTLSVEDALNVTEVALTAVLLPDSTLVTEPSAAHAALDRLLPTTACPAADGPGLLFVHGHRHRVEMALHGSALRLTHAGDWLLARTHVLLFCTDPTAPIGGLLRALHTYPQAVRMLVHTGANTGYRCGLLHSLAATQRVWRRYSFVVFTHPDVYLLPPAPSELGAAVRGAPRAAFLGSETRMFWHGASRPGAYLSDLFAFRPGWLPEARSARAGPDASRRPDRQPPEPGLSSGCAGQSRDGGAQASDRAVLGLTAGGPEPSHDGPGAGPSVTSDNGRSSYWHAASEACSLSWFRGRRLLKPEQALYQVQVAHNATYVPLGLERTVKYKRTSVSRSGVWHTHNVSEVSARLAALHFRAKERMRRTRGRSR
jgi:hypothetical protein